MREGPESGRGAGGVRVEEHRAPATRRAAAVAVSALALVVLACAYGASGQSKAQPAALISDKEQTYADDWFDRVMASVNQTVLGDTHYHTWSKARVRAETHRLVNALRGVAHREFTNNMQTRAAIAQAASRLAAREEGQSSALTQLGGRVQDLASTLGGALKSLNFAVRQLDEKEKGQERAQEDAFRELHELLHNNTAQIHSNRKAIDDGYTSAASSLTDLREHVDSLLATDRGDMTKGDDELRARIGAMRLALRKDVARLDGFAEQVKSGLAAQIKKERGDVGALDEKMGEAAKVLKEHSEGMAQIRGDQQSITADTQRNADVLSSLQDKLWEAQGHVGQLSKQLDADDLINKKSLSVASETATRISRDLDHSAAEVALVDSHLEGQRKADKQLAKKESDDFGELHTSLGKLQGEIKSAEGIRNDLASLSSNSQAKIDQTSSAIHELEGRAGQLQTQIASQSKDVEGLMARATVLESAEARLNGRVKQHSDSLDGDVASMQQKLSSMMGLKEDISNLATRTEEELKGVAVSIDEVKSRGDKQQKRLDERVGKLGERLDAHVEEQGGMVGNETRKLTGLQSDVHQLQAFEADASALQRKLVQELTDVTQSLGILDTKFSGQNVDVRSRIASLESAVARLPSGDDIEKRIQKATSLADRDAKDLGDLAERVKGVKGSEASSTQEIAGLGKALREHEKRAEERVGAVNAKLGEEGKVLKGMAQKLGDNGLLADIGKVFGV